MVYRGCGRLRGDLARKVAKQTANAVELMHSAGLVHGGLQCLQLCLKQTAKLPSDLTTSNILFQVSPRARRWSDEKVYSMLGQPVTEENPGQLTAWATHSP